MLACCFHWCREELSDNIMVPCQQQVLNFHFSAPDTWLFPVLFSTVQNSKVSCLQMVLRRKSCFQWIDIIPIIIITHDYHVTSIICSVCLDATVPGGSAISVCMLESFMNPQPWQFPTGLCVQVVAKSMQWLDTQGCQAPTGPMELGFVNIA